MVDLNTNRPIIILNVNGLNTMNKLQESSGSTVGLLCVKTLTLMHSVEVSKFSFSGVTITANSSWPCLLLCYEATRRPIARSQENISLQKYTSALYK